MAGISFDTKTIKRLGKLLKEAGPKATKALNLELKATAFDTLAIAKKKTPVDKGSLRAANNLEAVSKNEYKIGNNKDYAPYVEFGTGKKAEIPAELSDFAAQFKGGTGESWDKGLEEVKKWCIRKGIPKEAAYPIFVSILRNGVEAQPFLYPAFKAGRKLLIERVEAYIKDFELEK